MITRTANSAQGAWAEDLLDDETIDENNEFVVDATFSTGLNILAGPPKHGKSNISTQAAYSVITGTPFLGRFNSEQGKVLIISLEEGARLVKGRLKRILGAGQLPPRSLRFEFTWPSLRRGGTRVLANFLYNNRDIKLVIIDIYARFRGDTSKGAYNSDYAALGYLQKITNDMEVAVVVLHHTKKSATERELLSGLYGSFGLPGVADTCALLFRPNEEEFGVLRTLGRKGASCDSALRFDKSSGLWKYLGDYETHAISPERQAILEALNVTRQTLTPREIAQATGLQAKSISNMLRKLVKQGLVQAMPKCRYCITKAGATKAMQPW